MFRDSGTEGEEESEDGGILAPCLVKRLNMEDWRRRNRSLSPDYYDRPGTIRHRPGPPPPPRSRKAKRPNPTDEPEPDYVVKAYYRNVPTKIASTEHMNTDEDFKRAYTQGRNREKPSRVEVSSEILVEELQEISGLSIEDEPFV
jgi:hypothetical protein